MTFALVIRLRKLTGSVFLLNAKLGNIGLIINISRSIIYASQQGDFARAARNAAIQNNKK